MIKILRSVFLEAEQVESIIKLSKKTRVSQAAYIREAIDIVLAKHEKQLERKKQKKKGDNQKGGA